MFSRITNTLKTRIDYALSNMKDCSYFQYLDITGLDHRAIFVRYDIPLLISNENVPKDKYFPGWVISHCLESDKTFLESEKYFFLNIQEESVL